MYFVSHVLRHKSHTFVCTLYHTCSGTNLTRLCVLCVARAQAQISHVCVYFVSRVLRHKSHTFVCTLCCTCSGTNLTRLCVLCVARAQAQISHICVYFVSRVLRHKSHTFVCTLCRTCSGKQPGAGTQAAGRPTARTQGAAAAGAHVRCLGHCVLIV